MSICSLALPYGRGGHTEILRPLARASCAALPGSRSSACSGSGSVLFAQHAAPGGLESATGDITPVRQALSLRWLHDHRQRDQGQAAREAKADTVANGFWDLFKRLRCHVCSSPSPGGRASVVIPLRWARFGLHGERCDANIQLGTFHGSWGWSRSSAQKTIALEWRREGRQSAWSLSVKAWLEHLAGCGELPPALWPRKG
eukprot:SAG31_NODE_705_length_12695_cov_3.147007_10_plen_201_part_00